MSSTESNTGLARFYKGVVVEISPEHYPVEVAVENRTLIVHATNADGSLVTAVRPLKGTWHMHGPYDPAHVTLVRRGNHFYLRYGHEEHLDFRGDIAEEATFWYEVGRAHEVPNFDGRHRFAWSRDEALAALNAGTIDAVFLRTGTFNQRSQLSAFRFVDRLVGERFQRIMLIGEKELIPSAA